MKPVDIRKGGVGANTVGSADSISALIMGGVATANFALGEVKAVYNTAQAEALGLTQAYDEANKVRVWYHVKEFFRKYGESTELWVQLIAQNVTMETALSDTKGEYFKKIVATAKGRIKQLAICKNVPSGYTATILNGMDADSFNSISVAQGAAQWAWNSDRPLNIIVEGREFSGTASAAQDLRAIANLKAEEVSLVIAQDYDYAAKQDDLGKKHAAVGTVLGCVARRKVNENIGELIPSMNLTNSITKDFLVPAISSHTKVSDLEAQLDTLDAKGYIFALQHTDFDGVYFNDDHTCTPVVIDAEGNMNHSQISHGRTVGKAKRKLRTALMPKVKSVQPLDPSTGKLPVERIKYLEAIGNDVFDQMARPEEISEGRMTVDPESDLLAPPKELKTSFYVIPYGTIGRIRGDINLKQRR